MQPNPYRPGRKYLVTPGSRDGKLIDGICFSGRDVEHSSDVIDYLRRHLQDQSKTHIRGIVGAVDTDDPDLVEFLMTQGEGRPVKGATVSTTVGFRTYTAVTDSLGRYELSVPRSGRYAVQAGIAPYKTSRASIRIVRGEPCAVQNLAMSSGSSISGRVLDSNGQVIRSAQVGLFDLDRPITDEPARAWLRTEFPTQSDGSFRFDNVPIGRYLLAFNPDGPQAEGYQPYPLESTYFPGGSARDGAKIIEVDHGELRLIDKT